MPHDEDAAKVWLDYIQDQRQLRLVLAHNGGKWVDGAERGRGQPLLST
jgi:hypothetical protein